jgi:flagellar basal-body rod modification protein FlgD
MNITQINNTLNNLTNQTNRVQFEQGQKTMGSSKIGKDAFMNLLLTQLKYQDPINPVDNKEFIAQQAQFTQIEKMDELNANIINGNNLAAASNLVGKRVDITKEDGSVVTGSISSVLISDKGVGLKIGNDTFTPNQITRIYANEG